MLDFQMLNSGRLVVSQVKQIFTRVVMCEFYCVLLEIGWLKKLSNYQLSSINIIENRQWLSAQTADTDCGWLKQLKRFAAVLAFCFG